jgi:hypothetical protein
MVAGQASNASTNTTAYLPPVISGISGPGSSIANTDGGQLVFLSCSEVGPASASAAVSNDALISVHYGPLV